MNGFTYHITRRTVLSLTVLWFVILTIRTDITMPATDSVTTKFQVIINPGKYEQAAQTCKGVNNGVWDLPAPNHHLSLTVMDSTVIRLMESHSLPSVWINLRRRDFRQWTNLDNTSFDGQVQTNGDPKKTCVIMKLQYEALVSDTCQTHGYGYACQLNACSRCPSSISPANCFVKNGKCYFVGCDVATWFNAVNLCKKMEGGLATFNTAYQLQEFIAGIKSRRENVCKHYWVGLRKTDWCFSGIDGDREPEYYQWFSDNPKPGDDCAVLKKFSSGYYWESVNCTETHATICLKGHPKIPSTSKLLTHIGLGSEHGTPTWHYHTDTTTEEWTSEGQHCAGGIYRRLDFILGMWSFILISVGVYLFYLVLQRRSKVIKFLTRVCPPKKATTTTSEHDRGNGEACNGQCRHLVDMTDSVVENGLEGRSVCNPPG